MCIRDSYVDKHRASMPGRYRFAAEEGIEPYIKPQESGSHWGCSELTLSGSSESVRIYAAKPFSFSFCRYTQEELTTKRHRDVYKRQEMYSAFAARV